VIALLGAAGPKAQSDGRSGSRVESGAGPAPRLAPGPPARPCAVVAAAVAEGLLLREPVQEHLPRRRVEPADAGDKAMTPKPRGRVQETIYGSSPASVGL
jgi:hypothetical protein